MLDAFMPQQLYTLTAQNAAGRIIVSDERTARGAISLMLVLLAQGWHTFTLLPIVELPVADAHLCPCAQPGAAVAEGQVFG